MYTNISVCINKETHSLRWLFLKCSNFKFCSLVVFFHTKIIQMADHPLAIIRTRASHPHNYIYCSPYCCLYFVNGVQSCSPNFRSHLLLCLIPSYIYSYSHTWKTLHKLFDCSQHLLTFPFSCPQSWNQPLLHSSQHSLVVPNIFITFLSCHPHLNHLICHLCVPFHTP